MSCHLKRKGETYKSLVRIPAVFIIAALAVALFTTVPQRATAAEVVVGGELTPEVDLLNETSLIQEEMAYFSLEEAYDLSDVDVNLADYDILINVPVQLENLRENVDRFKIECIFGSRDINDPHARSDWIMVYKIVEDLPGNQYSGTIRFPLTIPPEGEWDYVSPDVPDDVEPQDVNHYYCELHVHNSETDEWGYTTPAAADLEFTAPWRESTTTMEELRTNGYIEW